MFRMSLIILLLTGCTNIEKQYDSDMEMIKWKRLTDKELLKKCGTWANGCYVKSYEDGFCYVFTGIPKYVNDNITCTLGHEVEHCFFGVYHGL